MFKVIMFKVITFKVYNKVISNVLMYITDNTFDKVHM